MTSRSSHAVQPVQTEAGSNTGEDAPRIDLNRAEDEGFDFYTRPASKDLDFFFSYHPQQPTRKGTTIYHTKDGIMRKWLTYCKKENSLYCTVCLAYAKPSASESAFIKGGMTAWKHVHQRIEEHERNQVHRDSAEAYFMMASQADIVSLLSGKQVSLHRDQVRKKRQVMDRVIEVIKVIGKCGLSYRGTKFEAAYTWDNIAVDHGNFLEMILLLSKFDVSLQEHVNECVQKSQSLNKTGVKGRGSFVTLLSKTSVNKVIDVISHLIKESISREVRQAGMFSLQIDTTQDITSTDQCAVILRYVTDVVHEKLIGVVDCESSTGEYFVELLKKTLAKVDIELRNCVGNSTDGAANMQGQYKGFSALLASESPNQVHIWCYAHVLNLVLGDTTSAVIESASLFSIVNDVAVFIKDSYKHMKMWEEVSDDKRHRRLSPIGETRWWAKDQALSKIFGCFGNPDNALYVDLILTLKRIVEDMSIKAHVRARAKGYMESLLKHETVLTASPLSRYLQTSGMDLITAHRLVMGAQDSLKSCNRDMDGVTKAANIFVEWANKELEENGSKEVVQGALPEKKIRKKKSMPGEVAEEEHSLNTEDQYRIKVHNVILDTVTQSIHARYSANGALYDDFACLDPRNFGTLRDRGLPSESLKQLSKCLLRFDERATSGRLNAELCSLANQWERLKLPHLESYTVRAAEETEDGEDMELNNTSCTSCKDCAICVYHILSKYNLLTDAYHVIGLAYKFLLTLSFSQVACERTFSTLKYVKNRLRSTLTQERLEAFMLMCTEKEILMTLDNDGVIDRVAESSKLLQRLLVM